MQNFDAGDESAAGVLCAVCEQRITGARWYARIRSGGRLVALCCPLCEDTFVRNPAPHIRRIETYLFMAGSGGAGAAEPGVGN